MDRFHSTPIYTHLFFLMLFGTSALLHGLWGAPGLVIALIIGGPLLAISLAAGRSFGVTKNPGNKNIVNAVALIGILLFALTLPSQGLLPSLLCFLVFIQLAQNFILHREREVYFAIAIVLVLVLFSASNSTSGFFIIYIVLFALSSTFVLVALQSAKMASAANQSQADKAHNSAIFPASISALGITILAVTSLLYMAIPQLPAGHIGFSFGAVDHYYRDRGWEQQADASEFDDSTGKQEDGETDSSGTEDADPDSGGEGRVEEGRTPSKTSPETAGSDRFFPGSPGAGPASEGSGEREDGTKGTENQAGSEAKQGGEQTGEKDTSSSSSSDFAYSGFNSEFNIEQPRDGSLSNKLILYLKADRGVYLRSHVFDRFDGERWFESLDTVEKYRLSRGQVDFSPVGNEKQYLRQAVIYEQAINSRIVAANYPVRLQFPASVVAAAHDGALSSPAVIQPGTRYTVYSDSGWAGSHPASGREPLRFSDDYLQLPEVLDPRIAPLVGELTAGKDPLDAAISLEQHLRSNYQYTLETAISSQNVTPVGHFLFETQTGHCEYFASSLAVMLRQAGIPSRLVTGFSATNKNPLTGYFEVRGLDAHAWVEAFFPEHGWVSLEPTPAYALPRPPEVRSTAVAFTEYLENLKQAEELLAESGSEKAVPTLSVRGLLQALRDGFLYLVNVLLLVVLRGLEAIKVPALILLALAATSAVGFYALRVPLLNLISLWRIRALSPGDTSALVSKTYTELERVLSRKGYARRRSDTVEEYQRTLDKEAFIDPFVTLARLYSQVAYGAYTPTKEEALGARACYVEIYKSS